ncbi:30S ribosomal protein S19 [Candidatus Woesearchaeota archaeon]|nr:30S ribosomal protein S19 [Candidatus Woesearchaeota archaeon]MBW3016564.1 30S ribosomal protein S19 [Candidatus Woesearchaeota archaeon]
MAKEFLYYGKNSQEIAKMSLEEFAKLVPSRERRKIKRGFTEIEKKLLADIKSNPKDIKTHARDMIIIPEMLGKTIKVYSGKEWVPVIITPELLGHRLGEFALTRRQVRHSAPGIGATRSSASLSVR